MNTFVLNTVKLNIQIEYIQIEYISCHSGAPYSRSLKMYSLLNEVAMPFTFICVEIIITFFVKINKLVGINSIHSTLEDGTNHRFKLVIEFEMSML